MWGGVACTQVDIFSDATAEQEESFQLALESNELALAVPPNITTVVIGEWPRKLGKKGREGRGGRGERGEGEGERGGGKYSPAPSSVLPFSVNELQLKLK